MIEEGFMRTATIETAKRIETLMLEMSELKNRIASIKKEVQQRFTQINSTMDEPATETRPLTHRLAISAGRALHRSRRRGLKPDEAKQAAIQAAKVVSKKYGVDELSNEVLETINQKTSVIFS